MYQSYLFHFQHLQIILGIIVLDVLSRTVFQVDLVIIDPNGVKYERAVVEEETIKWSIADQELDDELYRRGNAFVDDEAGQVIDGVNGFGALPYQIKRRRMIIPDESILEKQKQEWIDKIISS